MHLWTSFVIIGLVAVIVSTGLRSLYLSLNNSFLLQLCQAIACLILAAVVVAHL